MSSAICHPTFGWAKVTMGQHNHRQFGAVWEGSFLEGPLARKKVTCVQRQFALGQDAHGAYYDPTVDPHRGMLGVVAEIPAFTTPTWSLVCLTSLFFVKEEASEIQATEDIYLQTGDVVRLPNGMVIRAFGKPHKLSEHLRHRGVLEHLIPQLVHGGLRVQRPQVRVILSEASNLYEGPLTSVIQRVVDPLRLKTKAAEEARVQTGLQELATMAAAGRLQLRWMPKH